MEKRVGAFYKSKEDIVRGLDQLMEDTERYHVIIKFRGKTTTMLYNTDMKEFSDTQLSKIISVRYGARPRIYEERKVGYYD